MGSVTPMSLNITCTDLIARIDLMRTRDCHLLFASSATSFIYYRAVGSIKGIVILKLYETIESAFSV